MKTLKYGITHIETGDKAKDMPAAAEQTAQSIVAALDAFNYNGADPNLVLSRLAAVEAWNAGAVWRRAGTTAEMNAYAAAPEGFEWYNTTTRRTYYRLGGAWVPRVSVWNATGSATVPNGWAVHSANARWSAQGPVKTWNNGYVAPVDGAYRVELDVQLGGQNTLVAAVKKNNLVADFTGTAIRASTPGVPGETGLSLVSTLQLVAGDCITPATYWAGSATSMDTSASRFSVEIVS